MKKLEGYIRARTPLLHAAEAIRRGHITIGFVGGSITESFFGRRWSDKVVDWFVARFPGVSVDVENAAKGATGTRSAIFRVEEDILAPGCDLVFVETAVNDPPDAWGAAREGLLRKLLRGENDVVIAYTYMQDWYEEMLRGDVPESIRDWEKLAERYRLSSVFMSRYAFDLVMDGFLRWEEWLPDGLHPDHAGSRLYAQPVCALLEKEIGGAWESGKPLNGEESNEREKAGYALPEPLYADNWEGARALPLRDVKRQGAWRLARERRVSSVTYSLQTSSMKSGLSFSFAGRGLVLHIMMNIRHSAYRIRVDGGDWILRNEPVPEWARESEEWVKEEPPILFASGEHTAEIQPVFAPNALGSLFELCMIGVIG